MLNKTKRIAIAAAGLSVLCVVVLVLWKPWSAALGDGTQEGSVQPVPSDVISSQQTLNSSPASVAEAALSEEGFASLFPEGIEIVSSGPSRDEFNSDEEWQYYWEHFHEPDVAVKYGMPIVRDEKGRQHIPGEIRLWANERITNQEIKDLAEERGLHALIVSRDSNLSTLATIYSDDISADLDLMCEQFYDLEGITVEVDSSAGYWLDGVSTADTKQHGLASRTVLDVVHFMTASSLGLDPLSDKQAYLSYSKFDKA